MVQWAGLEDRRFHSRFNSVTPNARGRSGDIDAVMVYAFETIPFQARRRPGSVVIRRACCCVPQWRMGSPLSSTRATYNGLSLAIFSSIALIPSSKSSTSRSSKMSFYSPSHNMTVTDAGSSVSSSGSMNSHSKIVLLSFGAGECADPGHSHSAAPGSPSISISDTLCPPQSSYSWSASSQSSRGISPGLC